VGKGGTENRHSPNHHFQNAQYKDLDLLSLALLMRAEIVLWGFPPKERRQLLKRRLPVVQCLILQKASKSSLLLPADTTMHPLNI
jgi:hypothetical protein